LVPVPTVGIKDLNSDRGNVTFSAALAMAAGSLSPEWSISSAVPGWGQVAMTFITFSFAVYLSENIGGRDGFHTSIGTQDDYGDPEARKQQNKYGDSPQLWWWAIPAGAAAGYEFIKNWAIPEFEKNNNIQPADKTLVIQQYHPSIYNH
jgi:hypothetical protein